jgi:hypothetical protein
LWSFGIFSLRFGMLYREKSGNPGRVQWHVDWKQGDQIRRIFAYWVIVSLGSFCENYRGSPIM